MAEINLGRVRPVHEGDHVPAQAYERLSLVEDAAGATWLSNSAVPPDTPLSNSLYWYRLVSPNEGYIIASGAPAATINPTSRGVLYVDMDSGGIYSCIDNATDANIWKRGAGGDVDTPLLSGATSVNEGSSVDITIANYDDSLEYTIGSTTGTVVRSGNIITFTGADVTEDTAGSITCRARSECDGCSDVGTHGVLILYVAMVEDEVLVYNSASMTEFSTLTNASVTAGELTATARGSIAESNVITQGVGEDDYTQLRGTNELFKSEFKFSNISISDTANNLKSSIEIQDGEKLVIVKGDDSVHEITASGVTEIAGTGENIIPAMTAKDAPAGYTASASSSQRSTKDAWYAFNQSSDLLGWTTTAGIITGWLQIHDANGAVFSAISIRSGTGNVGGLPKDFTFEVSDTGAFTGEEETLLTKVDEIDWAPEEVRTYTLNNTSNKPYRRLVVSANNGGDWVTVDALEIIGQGAFWEMDTTAVTAGETPLKAYTVDKQVSFKFGTGAYQPAVANTDSYTPSGDDLLGVENYSDLVATAAGNTLQTKVELPELGKMTDLRATLWKEG